jgi:hypothetical protein
MGSTSEIDRVDAHGEDLSQPASGQERRDHDPPRAHLGVDGETALRKLDNGELDGTALEVAFKSRLFLLGEERPRQRVRSQPPTSSPSPKMRTASL